MIDKDSVKVKSFIAQVEGEAIEALKKVNSKHPRLNQERMEVSTFENSSGLIPRSYRDPDSPVGLIFCLVNYHLTQDLVAECIANTTGRLR